MRNLFITAMLAAAVLFAAPSFANGHDYAGGGFGGLVGGGYVGTATGSFDITTNGGSLAQTGIYENGSSFQFSANQGGAWASGAAGFGQTGFVGTTNGGSYATAVSFGVTNGYAGDYTNSTAGGVGSNYEVNVNGDWNMAEFGGFIGFGAGVFTSW